MTDGRYPGQTLGLFSHDETADVGAVFLVIGVPGQAEIEESVRAVQLAVEVLSLTEVNLGVVRERILRLPGGIKHRTSITTRRSAELTPDLSPPEIFRSKRNRNVPERVHIKALVLSIFSCQILLVSSGLQVLFFFNFSIPFHVCLL